jgi:uncharacterized protein (TIGR02271 family)
LSSESTIAWDDVIKKEARGAIDDSDFGEVQEVGQNYVKTEKGMISKKKYYIPKYLVQGYDGETLWFNASENELVDWARDYAPSYDEYLGYKKTAQVQQEVPSDIETRIPLIQERLKITKTKTASDVTVKKVPRTETQTVEVPVTKEELVVETRPATSDTATTTTESPVTSETEQKVQLTEEHVHVTKEPFVKEEVVLKKKPVTETQTVTDTITTEEVDVQGADKTSKE